MAKYGDIQYLIDSPNPSKIYLDARRIAFYQLQKQFAINNMIGAKSSHESFKWIKAELTYPSFGHFTFAYKSTIFSVVIELIDTKGSSFNDNIKNRLLDACEENNLTPCLFKVNLRDETDSLFNKVLYESNKKEEYQLEPINSAWNLFDAKTNEEIDPLLYAKEDTIVIWGLDVKPFEVEKTEEIKKCITENEISINEVCEIVEYDIIELYKLCVNCFYYSRCFITDSSTFCFF